MCYYEGHIVASTWLLTTRNSQSENVLKTIVNNCLWYFIHKKTQQWHLYKTPQSKNVFQIFSDAELVAMISMASYNKVLLLGINMTSVSATYS